MCLNTFSDILTVINGAQHIQPANLNASYADAMVVDAKRKQVYLLSYESDALTIVNSETNAITKMPIGGLHLWGIVEAGTKLYVTRVQDAAVEVIDLKSHAMTKIAIEEMPCALAEEAATGEIYAVNYSDNSVSIIDDARDVVIGTVR